MAGSASLRLAVHLDALWAEPRAYFRCVWWWITGKRLRARMGLAPLLAGSPRAYRLWQSRQATLNVAGPANAPAILALVVDGDGDGLPTTLASLEREGIEARVVPGIDGSNGNRGGVDAWLLPMASGDSLAQGAGAKYRAAVAAASDSNHLIYADDDLIDTQGRRSSPHLKPDWNAELFRHFDFLSGAAIVRANAAHDTGAGLIGQALESCQQAGGEPIHLRHILHHRRERPAPIRPLAPTYPLAANETLPSVSIIVPTRDRVELLRTCLDGLARTDFPTKPEILVIDNGSSDPETLDYLADLDPAFATVLRDDGPFNFAALNNRAVEQTSGEVLCFLNNDIEVREPLWLRVMVRQAVREDVGAVGARLLYPDGRIQHAGVVIGIGNAAAHAHRTLNPQEEGYFHRHSLPQFVSAVTAACMVVRRERFEAVGGFDAERFAVSFNDVDLCLRLGERGWRSLYDPRATLVHHESVSRGLDRDPAGAARQAREVAALQERWHTGLAQSGHTREGRAPDPFHHPELSPLSERFVLRL